MCAFLDDYAGTTGTLVRLLRPGGLFVQWDWELDPHAHEPFGLTRKQVRATLSGSLDADNHPKIVFKSTKVHPYGTMIAER